MWINKSIYIIIMSGKVVLELGVVCFFFNLYFFKELMSILLFNCND